MSSGTHAVLPSHRKLQAPPPPLLENRGCWEKIHFLLHENRPTEVCERLQRSWFCFLDLVISAAEKKNVLIVFSFCPSVFSFPVFRGGGRRGGDPGD